MRAVVIGCLCAAAAVATAQEIPAEEEAALAAGLQVAADGLSPAEVARRAMDTSYRAAAAAASLRSAAARVDGAWAEFFPRLTSSYSYTRLSDFTPQSLGNFVITPGAAGPITSVSANPATPTLVAVPFALPPVLDNWMLQASLTVPVSDYFLKLNHAYSAATHARLAARFDLGAARAQSAAEGKVALYDWLRAQGARVVAELALRDQETHLRDTRTLFTVGNASQVDLLRGQTAVASAQLVVVRARQLVELTAKQLRVALHVGDEAPLASAERIDGARPAALAEPLPALIAEAQAQRLEVRSLDANADSAGAQARQARAAAYPALNLFGGAEYGNPNPRVFPETSQWSFTWEAGARLSWSPNDVALGVERGRDAEGRAAGLVAQREALRDGIAVEVTQAYEAVQAADFALGSTGAELTSAREAVRVARELFKAGRINSTTLTDAETDLTRARLALLNARIDARTTRVRLEHAVGRDSRLALAR